MERLRRISAFWNWLPAFRAVAETEHLRTASEQLHITAPALSRSIKLLEKELGQTLFRRAGRRIELNEAGEKFLSAVRDAMRLVHEGMLEVQSEQLLGRVHVASAGVATQYVIPALNRLRRENDGLIPWLSDASPEEVPSQLLRGVIDAAFSSFPVSHPRLASEHLGEATNGVYCGPGHPLYRKRKVSVEELLEHPFVAPVPGPDGLTGEGWPPELTRRIGMHVAQMRVGLEICEREGLLAVLPDVIAKSHRDAQLHRIPIDLIPPTQIFAAIRPALGRTSRATVVADAVRREIEAANVRRR